MTKTSLISKAFRALTQLMYIVESIASIVFHCNIMHISNEFFIHQNLPIKD